MSPELQAALAAARAADAIIKPLYRRGVAVEIKADRSPVTEADRGAEQAIRAILSERFPHGTHETVGQWRRHCGSGAAEARVRVSAAVHQLAVTLAGCSDSANRSIRSAPSRSRSIDVAYEMRR